MSESGLGAGVRGVVARPRLWSTALRQVRVLAPAGWWRRWPFLPLPDRDWMAFRLTTAYGDPKAPIGVDDLVVWLEWSRAQDLARASIQTPDRRIRTHR